MMDTENYIISFPKGMNLAASKIFRKLSNNPESSVFDSPAYLYAVCTIFVGSYASGGVCSISTDISQQLVDLYCLEYKGTLPIVYGGRDDN